MKWDCRRLRRRVASFLRFGFLRCTILNARAPSCGCEVFLRRSLICLGELGILRREVMLAPGVE